MIRVGWFTKVLGLVLGLVLLGFGVSSAAASNAPQQAGSKWWTPRAAAPIASNAWAEQVASNAWAQQQAVTPIHIASNAWAEQVASNAWAVQHSVLRTAGTVCYGIRNAGWGEGQICMNIASDYTIAWSNDTDHNGECVYVRVQDVMGGAWRTLWPLNCYDDKWVGQRVNSTIWAARLKQTGGNDAIWLKP